MDTPARGWKAYIQGRSGPHRHLQALPHLQAQNLLPETQIFLPIRDGRDQVKFQPTCGKPTTFRAQLGERPL